MIKSGSTSLKDKVEGVDVLHVSAKSASKSACPTLKS